jgi:hypothetical protein
MEFKKGSLKLILFASCLSILLFGLVLWEFSPKANSSALENNETQNPAALPPMASQPAPPTSKEEDTAIQEQLDRDRKQQKQTKDLRIKLEQTNLELEQEKALAQINKLKKENRGAFNEPSAEGQNNLPEIKIDYIGGDSVKKEAILSIGGTSYQVKEKSNPVANIQVVSISDSSVTLHFSAPEEMTKTVDYKPE